MRDCVRLCTWLRSLCSASSRRTSYCVFSASLPRRPRQRRGAGMADRRELGQRGMRAQHGRAPRASYRPGRQRRNGQRAPGRTRQCGVDTKYTFHADASSPRTLILLDDTASARSSRWTAGPGRRPCLTRRPNLKSVDCVYIEGYTRYPTRHSGRGWSALLVASPRAWRNNVGLRASWSGQTQYNDAAAGTFRPCAPYR